ncbi:hypothetical protein [Methyloceanibacter caenitepidi]|uniref:Uncharacterized protein n=1 Tax=Methyloceanibacter caenitepidi TaxID=1384459 RepID=A0A0A8JZ76_9HYPH|nr:hypothetical protein [Methyloceanibacter caenitepidi]BAQ16113.1 hypothetical protein GL4_0650 [Methyloceanibacter caenitepidi]
METVALSVLFAVLNRLRGWVGILVWLAAGAFGLIVWALTGEWIAAAAATGAFVIGESWGWTKWIRCTPGHFTQKQYDVLFLDDDTGKINGTYWLAELIAPERKDYWAHCFLGAYLRGLWWWLPVFGVLAWFGLVNFVDGAVSAAALSFAFPVVYWLAYRLPEIFGLRYLMRAEIIYGAIYGAVLGLTLFGV